MQYYLVCGLLIPVGVRPGQGVRLGGGPSTRLAYASLRNMPSTWIIGVRPGPIKYVWYPTHANIWLAWDSGGRRRSTLPGLNPVSQQSGRVTRPARFTRFTPELS